MNISNNSDQFYQTLPSVLSFIHEEVKKLAEQQGDINALKAKKKLANDFIRIMHALILLKKSGCYPKPDLDIEKKEREDRQNKFLKSFGMNPITQREQQEVEKIAIEIRKQGMEIIKSFQVKHTKGKLIQQVKQPTYQYSILGKEYECDFLARWFKPLR